MDLEIEENRRITDEEAKTIIKEFAKQQIFLILKGRILRQKWILKRDKTRSIVCQANRKVEGHK